jgi:hypothetical protein
MFGSHDFSWRINPDDSAWFPAKALFFLALAGNNYPAARRSGAFSAPAAGFSGPSDR